jgi:DNA-binding XRE family transcriptional regulator
MATSDSTKKTRYLPIHGFPGYEVGDDGTVWSCKRQRADVASQGIMRRVKPGVTQTGYFRVDLYRNGKAQHRYVHRLVLEAFSGSCSDEMECRHLDGNKANNRLTNLVWGTRLENAVDRRLHGAIPLGSQHGLAKLTEELVKEIRQRYATEGITQKQLAEEYRISASSINLIVRDKAWKHVPPS